MQTETTRSFSVAGRIFVCSWSMRVSFRSASLIASASSTPAGFSPAANTSHPTGMEPLVQLAYSRCSGIACRAGVGFARLRSRKWLGRCFRT